MVIRTGQPSDLLLLFSSTGKVKSLWGPRDEKKAIRLLGKKNAWACFDSEYWVIGVRDGRLTRIEHAPDPVFFFECWRYNICWSCLRTSLDVSPFEIFTRVYSLDELLEHSIPATFNKDSKADWPRGGRTGLIVYPDHHSVFFLVASAEEGWSSQEWTDSKDHDDYLEDADDPMSWAGSPQIRYFDDQYDKAVERMLWGVRDFARVGGIGEFLTQADLCGDCSH